MKGERHFEYITRDITQEDAIRIADSIDVHLEFTDDSALFFADIDTRQIELLDKRLNAYTIQFTQSLCETAAIERIRIDLDTHTEDGRYKYIELTACGSDPIDRFKAWLFRDPDMVFSLDFSIRIRDVLAEQLIQYDRKLYPSPEF